MESTFAVFHERFDKTDVEDASAKNNILDRVYELQPSLKVPKLIRAPFVSQYDCLLFN